MNLFILRICLDADTLDVPFKMEYEILSKIVKVNL